MSSSRVQIALTGAPTAFDVSTASSTKSDLAAPAKPAAKVRRVDEDLALGQAGRSHRCLLGGGLRLRRHPHVATILLHVRGAVHRLHARVREERRFEHALDDARRWSQRRVQKDPAC